MPWGAYNFLVQNAECAIIKEGRVILAKGT